MQQQTDAVLLEDEPVFIPNHLLNPTQVLFMNRDPAPAEELKLRARFPGAEIIAIDEIRTSAQWKSAFEKYSKRRGDTFVVLANPQDFPIAAGLIDREVPHGRVYGKKDGSAGIVRVIVNLFDPEPITRIVALKILFFIDRKKRAQLDLGRARAAMAEIIPPQLMARKSDWEVPIYLGDLMRTSEETGWRPPFIWAKHCEEWLERQNHVLVMADLGEIKMGAMAMRAGVQHYTLIERQLKRISIAFEEM